MKKWLSYYHPKIGFFLTYMLQQVEYNPSKFIKWIASMPDLTQVMRRQKLVMTLKAKLLVGLVSLVYLFYIIVSIWTFLVNPVNGLIGLVLTPFLVILLTYLIVLFGWLYYEEPRRSRLLKESERRFKNHTGIKIAVSGSYGKTTMKELLHTVLSVSMNVAYTPGNKNVPISHAFWSKQLTGQEDVLIIEYGEGAPGDIKKLAKLTHPHYGIITGLAPNHLDQYKSLAAVATDLLELGNFVDPHKLFINSSGFAQKDIAKYMEYSNYSVPGWSISNIRVNYKGTSFTMRNGKKTISVNSGLMGHHQVGPLALVAMLAHDLGMNIKDIELGISKTVPYEHRMQPRNQFGAWIIDDTYNGSIEGIRAGLHLLTVLEAKRKIYVTPGLVDQGIETKNVHLEIGRLIAQAQPDKVVLMNNSVTEFIVKALKENNYKGELHIEADPLNYYLNLEHVLAAGDLVMLQNDWTDNYI